MAQMEEEERKRYEEQKRLEEEERIRQEELEKYVTETGVHNLDGFGPFYLVYNKLLKFMCIFV